MVEAWMPPEPLEACGIEHCNSCIDQNQPQNSNSVLYNAMIHPLVQLSIKGALWYQGNLLLRHKCKQTADIGPRHSGPKLPKIPL